MSEAGEKKKREVNRIVDESGDPKYYVRIPRLIWATARDTYDYTFYAVVKDIAGENGECWLGTESLASLCKMSEGKAADCREFWLTTGYISGELHSTGERSVWHLKVKNIWDENTRWSENNPTIDDRLDHAAEQKESAGGGYVNRIKTCKRCRKGFTATGRRSKRCPECARAAQLEQIAVNKVIKTPTRDFLANIPEESRKCEKCEARDALELHLADVASKKIAVLCEACHDALHAPGPENEKIHGMNLPESGQLNSCDEFTGEKIHGIDFPPPVNLWHELKKNQTLKNNQTDENNQERPTALAPSPGEERRFWTQVWRAIQEQLEMQMQREKYAMYVKPAWLIGPESGKLRIGVPSDLIRDWNNSRIKTTVDRALETLVPGESPVREVDFITARPPSLGN